MPFILGEKTVAVKKKEYTTKKSLKTHTSCAIKLTERNLFSPNKCSFDAKFNSLLHVI